MKIKRWIKGIVYICLILCLSGACIVYAGRNATGASFRMEKIEGTVLITDEKGSNVSFTEDMLLYSGDTVNTDAKSYAYVNLDDSKLIKIDELSKASLRKNGKKLELGVDEGAVYFEVNKKLADDESMVIGDSTISLSIRGTTGVFSKRKIAGVYQYTIMLLEGRATVSCMGSGTFQIWGGEKVEYIPSLGAFHRTLIRVTEIPGFADVEIRAKQDVAAKVVASGIDLEWIVANADSKLAADQASNYSQYKDVFTGIPKEEQQISNPSSDSDDSDDSADNSSEGKDDTSGGSGGNSSDNDDSGDDSGDSGDDSGDSGDDSGDSGDDSGDSGDDDTTIDMLVIKGAGTQYEVVQDGEYIASLTYLDDEGNNKKIWLTEESALYQGLEWNDVLDEFEITITNFRETPDDDEYYGIGKIDSITQVTDTQFTFRNSISIDVSFELKNTCTVVTNIYFTCEEAKLKAKDIILGNETTTGNLLISDGNAHVNNVYSKKGNIHVYTANGLNISNEFINQNILEFVCADESSITCNTLVNDGNTCIIKNLRNDMNTCLANVTLINNGFLQITNGLTIKRWENNNGSYFEHFPLPDVDDTYAVVVTDGLIISDLQKTADEKVYLSTDGILPVSGTFEGENELYYTADSNGDPCFELVTSDASGDSSTTDSDSYTGQIVNYEGTSITILNDETSQNETIQLGTYSPMLDSLKSNGVLTEFKATIKKQENSGYKVTTAEQTSGNGITLENEIVLRNESLKLIGNTEIVNNVSVIGTSVLEAEVLDLGKEEQYAIIRVVDGGELRANHVNVPANGILDVLRNASLYITNAITIYDGGALNIGYNNEATIGTFDIMINSTGTCVITGSEDGSNDIFCNVSILNLGKIVIDNTTVNSLTNGDGAIVENTGGNLIILNP